jgi:hypothetical protein
VKLAAGPATEACVPTCVTLTGAVASSAAAADINPPISAAVAGSFMFALLIDASSVAGTGASDKPL